MNTHEKAVFDECGDGLTCIDCEDSVAEDGPEDADRETESEAETDTGGVWLAEAERDEGADAKDVDESDDGSDKEIELVTDVGGRDEDITKEADVMDADEAELDLLDDRELGPCDEDNPDEE